MMDSFRGWWRKAMRFVAILIVLVLFAQIAVAQIIPPMPSKPDRSPDATRPVRGCSVLRLGYDTPETVNKDYYGLSFWVLVSDPDRPFIAAAFADDGGRFWIDLDRDGIAEEYYPNVDVLNTRYPRRDLCEEIVPRVR